MPRPPQPHTAPRIIHRPDRLTVDKGEQCICPGWLEGCSWLDCLTKCQACKKQRRAS